LQELLIQKLAIAGLDRLESAARTEDDFTFVIKRWDELQKRRERKDNQEKGFLLSDEMFDWSIFEGETKMRGEDDILSMIFCCPCQMHELMDDPDLSRLINKATDKQKAVFFPMFFKECKDPKIAKAVQIAICHNMTERNVRKLIDLMVGNIRIGYYEALKQRYDADPLSLSKEAKNFLANYIPKEKKAKKRKKSKMD
jgi:hypothetical protein